MSYDLKRVQKEFCEACIAAKVTPISADCIKLNGRLTRTLGRVTHNYNKEKKHYEPSLVEFSKSFISTGTDDCIRDVILHEAAHYIVMIRYGQPHGHDEVFKAVCAELGTDNDSPATKVELTVPQETVYKYSILCPTCNKIIGGYSRRCKTIDQIDSCYCKICGNGGLKVINNW